MIEYLNQHPTQADILSAVYKVKPKSSSKSMGKSWRDLTKREYDAQLGAEKGLIPEVLGGGQSAIPSDVREDMRRAEEELNRMFGKNKVN